MNLRCKIKNNAGRGLPPGGTLSSNLQKQFRHLLRAERACQAPRVTTKFWQRAGWLVDLNAGNVWLLDRCHGEFSKTILDQTVIIAQFTRRSIENQPALIDE